MIAFPTGAKLAARPARREAPPLVGTGSPPLNAGESTSIRRLKANFSEVYTQAWPDLPTTMPLVIGVTSALRGEGRTTTALGTALAVARDMAVNVLLLELDLEQASLAKDLGVSDNPGLVDVLSGEAQLTEALRQLPCGIDLLPAGVDAQSTSRLLRSVALRQLLDTARQVYDVTVLDLPPALSSSDIVPLSNLTDYMLMAVRAGATPARLVDQALARFAPGKVRGMVMNGQRSKIPNWVRHLI